MVAKKDYNAPKHEELDVPNLEVIKAMQSLTSKGLVKTQFSWQWYYYVLTPEGVDYLREWYESMRVASESASHYRLHTGLTSRARLSPRRTKRPSAPSARLVCALVARVLTAPRAATGRITGRRRMRRASSAHGSPVLVGVLPGSRCVHLYRVCGVA